MPSARPRRTSSRLGKPSHRRTLTCWASAPGRFPPFRSEASWRTAPHSREGHLELHSTRSQSDPRMLLDQLALRPSPSSARGPGGQLHSRGALEHRSGSKQTQHLTQISAHVREFNEIEHARPLDNTGPLVITAIATNQVSIGGCPQKLQLFRSVLTNDLGSACRVSRLEIFAPYHSPELEHEASLVMLDLERRGILHDATLPSSEKTIWETVNAQVAMETSVRDMLRTLVESNLCRTADWDAYDQQFDPAGGRIVRFNFSQVVSDRLLWTGHPSRS